VTLTSTRRGASPAGSVLAISAIAASLLVGCSSRPHPTLQELRGVPGATASLPGASEYRRVATDSAAGPDGGTPASIAVDACTTRTAAELTSWFDQHLTAAGWSHDPATHDVDPGLYTKGFAWVREHRRFDLLLDTRANADRLAAAAGQPAGCPTAYRTLVQ
jgi:hypothetical protein